MSNPETRPALQDRVPRLSEEEELTLMRDMTQRLTDACNVTVRSEPGATTRDRALINATLASRGFRDEGGHDWAVDAAAEAFIARHGGTEEARALRETMTRARDILRDDSQ